MEVDGWLLPTYGLAAWTLCLALLLALAVISKAAGDIRWLVGVPALLLLLTTFGPWGAESSVVRSQLTRLSEAAGRRASGGVLAPEEMASLRKGISDLGLLRRLRDVRRLLPPEQAGDPIWDKEPLSAFEVIRVADLQGAPSQADAVPSFNSFRIFAADLSGDGLDLAGFDLALRVVHTSFQQGREADRSQAWAADLTEDGQGIAIRHGDIVDRVALGEVITALLRRAPETDGLPERADLTSQGGRAIRLQVDQAGLDTRLRTLNGLGATILLRRAEWVAR
jgi:hypothetical protein